MSPGEGVLGLDCSGVTHSAGLLWDPWGPTEAAEITSLEPRSALRQLPGNIARLLRSAGLPSRGLAAVGVTAGPGSFTGVRLGVTLARTTSMVAGCPLYGLDTLEVMAAQCAGPGEVVAVAVDARRGEVYSALFRSLGPHRRPERLIDTAARRPEPLLGLLEGTALDLCLGSGFEAYREALTEPLGSAVKKVVAGPDLAPSGLTVARLAGELLASGEPGSPELLPSYCREAEVQVDSSSSGRAS